MRSRQRGYTLVELLVASSLLLGLLLMAAPPLLEATAALRLEVAAAELVGTLRLARSAAVRWDTNAAVKFRPRPDGTVTFALYRDGDGDGVLNADIAAGVDPELAPPRPLAHFGPRLWFGFPAGPPPPDPGDPRGRLAGDPVRFNRSDLASFGPLGTSTPGSLYLTDGKRLVAVRVFGRTGKVRVLAYDAETRSWR
ncbi:MAG TPA: prepilin-type N-terminal cleavage/methylation domain-containing protein [Thermoanaerobaculia bacterium]|nr:prepilin-type N-terminal cleavage/methylation domain-containing protein [Thermoanaerobaculia bacterium]